MKKFNYKDELKKIIENKQLTQVYLNGEPNQFKVAYIIDANSDYLTLGEINDNTSLDGVGIYRIRDIALLKVDTVYLNEFIKQINHDSLYKQISSDLVGIKKFTIEGFVSVFENTNTVVEILTEDANALVGRIIAHDDEAVVLAEFKAEVDRSMGRTYVNFDMIARIAVDIPYLRVISKSLTDKNL